MIKLVLRSDIPFDEPLQARSISSGPGVLLAAHTEPIGLLPSFFFTLPLPCVCVFVCACVLWLLSQTASDSIHRS